MFNEKYSLTVQNFYNIQKSPHFLLRGKVGQLSKRKRVLCMSIDINSLCIEAYSDLCRAGQNLPCKPDRPVRHEHTLYVHYYTMYMYL